MDDRQAIATAKTFMQDVYADEGVLGLRLEEFDHIAAAGHWLVTLSFARPWDAPRTRAQEVLENLGATTPVQRVLKVVTLAQDGTVLSVKDKAYQLAAE